MAVSPTEPQFHPDTGKPGRCDGPRPCLRGPLARGSGDPAGMDLETLHALGIRQKESMKRHTSFKIGGPADFFAAPPTMGRLEKLLHLARRHHLPLLFMGSGTNLLVMDQGIRGLVISLAALKAPVRITPLTEGYCQVRVWAGTSLAGLHRQTMARGIGGLSFAAGIPGTVGGAIMMNAGTTGGAMADVLQSIDLLDRDGGITTLDRAALDFYHRRLVLPAEFQEPSPLILRATLTMEKQDPDDIRSQWQKRIAQRRASQPWGMAGAGCFFKNPPTGPSAGALIDRAGLKGRRVGDAMVSETHANFIINQKNATAADVLALAGQIRKTVAERFGILLENEVKIEGEPKTEKN